MYFLMNQLTIEEIRILQILYRGVYNHVIGTIVFCMFWICFSTTPSLFIAIFTWYNMCDKMGYIQKCPHMIPK